MKKRNWRLMLRRVLNLVFSRLVITVTLVLLQVFWLFSVFHWLDAYSTWLNGVGLALSVIMCLALIRQDSTAPEFKISWMIIFMLMPVQGGLLYLLWGNKRPALGLRHRLERAEDAMAPARKDDPDGQSMFADMLPALQSAEHSIYVESFIIGMGEMWGQIHEILRQKAAAGLDVRVIYDDAGCLSLLPHNYAEMMRADGIRAFSFNRCVPLLNLVMNNRDHRKIMVIDGKIGFTGGVNLADEYINKLERFGYWKDSGVRLEGPGATALANIFLTFWKAQYPDEEIDMDRDLPLAAPVKTDCLVQPFADSPVDREAVAKNVYLELINQAQRRLYICTPYLILDNDLLTCLRLAAKRGVDVRIYTPGVPDKPTIYQLTRSYFPHLLRAGVKIYSYTPGFLHAKTWLVDDRIAAVGTVNLDYRSLYLHFENSVLIYGGAVLEDVRKDLAEIERESKELTLGDCRTGFVGTMYSAVLRLVAPLC